MPRKGFSTEFDAEKTALARGKDLRCSPKASRNIALAIKGMRLGDAKEFLEAVVEMRTAVPMRVRNRKIKHRKGDGFGPGGFPVGAASRILTVLENAENNAEYKDLETDNLRIIHASAYRGETQVRFKPRAHGRASAFNDHTTNFELVLGEVETLDEAEEKKKERREKGGSRPAKKGAAKPKPKKKAEAAETAAGKTETKEEA
jgi:large subunit ribosomal protein L22